MRKLLLLIDPEPDADERMTAAGYTLVRVEGDLSAANIGSLLAWVCADATAVYMGPKWRTCVLSRAVRAAAVAADVTVLGFE